MNWMIYKERENQNNPIQTSHWWYHNTDKKVEKLYVVCYLALANSYLHYTWRPLPLNYYIVFLGQ